MLLCVAQSALDVGLLEVAEPLFSLMSAAVRHEEGDVSLTAASTMATLDRGGPRRVSDLAAIEGVTQPSMTVLLTGLERAGYVQRGSDPSDGRAVLVALTDEGRAYRLRRRRAGAERFALLMEKLAPPERDALLAARGALERLSALAGPEGDGRE